MARDSIVLAFRPPRRRTQRMPKDLAPLSDEALVALVVRSDEVALAELYDRYGRTAYGLALRILRDEALAEGAVQEGFLPGRGPRRGAGGGGRRQGGAGLARVGAGGGARGPAEAARPAAGGARARVL